MPGAWRGGGGQQLQPFGGSAGGGEQVRAGHDGADEGVVVEREEVEAAAARRAQPGQRLVHLGQGGGVRQRAGEVAGGVPQVALVQRQPGQRQLLRRGERGSSVPSGTSSFSFVSGQLRKPRRSLRSLVIPLRSSCSFRCCVSALNVQD